MTILSETDLAALNLARTVLQRVDRTATLNAWNQETNDRPTPQDLGRIAEAASMANDAIFNVLNVTNAHGAQKIEEHIMHNRAPEREEAAL